MNTAKTVVALAAAFFLLSGAGGAAAEKDEEALALQFAAGPDKVRLVELFTTQARSTSPAAERWLSGLLDDPGLWTEIVPVSFHIDYFDWRGWKDRLASPQYTDRFRTWLARWKSSTPYAPLVALDGTEWSGWARGDAFPPASPQKAGMLSVRAISENEYRVLFSPDELLRGPWVAHGALLAFGIETRVEAGENRGKVLRQDFVAMAFDKKVMEPVREGFRTTLRLPAKQAEAFADDGLAVVFWVSREDDILPVQATGGELPGFRKKKPSRT